MNQQPTHDGIDLGRVISAVTDRWYVVAGCVALVVVVAAGYAKIIAKPVYEATAMVSYTDPKRSENPTSAMPSTGITRENIQTLIGAAGRSVVMSAAATRAGVEAKDMQRDVRIGAHGDASIIDVIARSTSAHESAALANAYAHAFVDDRRRQASIGLDAQIAATTRDLAALPRKLAADDARSVLSNTLRTQLSDQQAAKRDWLNSLQVSAEAQPPSVPVWPRTTLMIGVALVIGFGLGVGLALVLARTDRRLHGDEWDELPAPVIVRVPSALHAPRSGPISPHTADPQVADAFAALGARMLLDRSGDGAHVVMVSSARSGEGKSSVSANLAAALAASGRRVVLVDADMRRPTMGDVFPALNGRPGLSQVVTGVAQVEQALTLVAANLAALGSGPRQGNASTLLASVSFRSLVDRLTGICEVVIIDTPPVLAVTDALAIASLADHVLVCARVDVSNSGEVAVASERIREAAGVSQSVVLVGTDRPVGYGYDTEGLWPAEQQQIPADPNAGGAVA